MRVETNYPWDGRVTFTVKSLSGIDTLGLRVPSWCRDARVTAPSGTQNAEGGMLAVPVCGGDVVTMDMTMPIDRIYEDERVAECSGRVCVRRGPVVYCAEEVDNPGIPPEYFPAELALPADLPLTVGEPLPELGNVLPIVGEGIRLIPYAMWDNRAEGAMTVWLRES